METRRLAELRTLTRWCFVLCFLCIPLVGPVGHAVAEEPPSEEPPSEEPEVLDLVPGTVTKVGNFGFGLVPDDEPGTRYAPTEPLPESFQQDGLKVRFSGVVGDPDDVGGRGRRWGTPLEVTHIELPDEASASARAAL